jgi:hypothetical protein
MATTYHGRGLVTCLLIQEPHAMAGWTILCLRCGLTSWNGHDVCFQFCGRCSRFHEGGRVEACGALPPAGL